MEQDSNLPLNLSVIILVDEKTTQLLASTLTSIAQQSLDKQFFEVIIASTLSIQEELFQSLLSDNPEIKISQLVEVSNSKLIVSSLTKTRGKFVFVINAGDRIDSDFLKKGILVLESENKIGFVYMSLRKFGFSEIFATPDEFRPRSLFFKNTIVGPVYRGDLIRKIVRSLSSRKNILKEVFFHKILIKIMSKGYWGKPVNDSTYYLYTDFAISNTARQELYNETMLMCRTCWLDFRLIHKAQDNYNIFINHGRFNQHQGAHAKQSYLAKKLSQILNRHVDYPSLKLLLCFFSQRAFRRHFIDKEFIRTEAEYLIDYAEKPNYSNFKLPSANDLKNTIIFAHEAWVLGGGEKVLLNWIDSIGFEEHGIKRIDVVRRSYHNYEFMREDFASTVEEQYAIDRLTATPKQALRLCWEMIISERPKVILIMSNAFFYALTPLVKKYFPNIKIVDLLHNEWAEDPGWFSVSNEYAGFLDHRFVISDTWKQVLISKYKQPEDRITICENGIDLEKYNIQKYNKDELRSKFKLKADRLVISFIGRINRQKAPEVFLELVKNFLGNDQYQFVFVGNKDDDPEYVKQIENLIAALPNLKFFGETDKVAEFLAVSDLLVLPSKFEGYPLISLEAAAMAVPVVATNIIGFREQIQKGQFGILYDQSTKELDAKKIKEIIISQFEELKDAAKLGPRFVFENANLDTVKQKYKAVLGSFYK